MPLIVAAMVTGLALILVPWVVIAWGRRVGRRAPPDAPISRWLWRLCVLLPLVPLGAYLLVGHLVMTWGWATTLWLLSASALRGLLDREA